MNVRPTRCFALIAAVLPLAAASSSAATVPLPNGGFERAAANGAASWSVDGTLPPGADVVRAADVPGG